MGIVLDPMVTLLFSFSTSSLHLPENSWRSKSTLSSISKPCLCVVQNHGFYYLFFVGVRGGGWFGVYLYVCSWTWHQARPFHTHLKMLLIMVLCPLSRPVRFPILIMPKFAMSVPDKLWSGSSMIDLYLYAFQTVESGST